MAEIPVEKRSSHTWLWVLLALLIVALLAWWLLDDDGDNVVEYVDEDVAAETAMTSGLTVGQQINLERAQVTSLAGDMAFMIDMNGESVPVFFDEVRTPDTPTEGRYDINPGTVVNITGEVRQATDSLPERADPSILNSGQNYIWASSLEPVE